MVSPYSSLSHHHFCTHGLFAIVIHNHILFFLHFNFTWGKKFSMNFSHNNSWNIFNEPKNNQLSKLKLKNWIGKWHQTTMMRVNSRGRQQFQWICLWKWIYFSNWKSRSENMIVKLNWICCHFLGIIRKPSCGCSGFRTTGRHTLENEKVLNSV